MIEGAKRNKNGMLQSVPWSAGHLLSIAWKSKPADHMQREASKRVPEHFFAGRKLRSFKVSKNCVWPSNKRSARFVELREEFAKS